MPRRWRRCLRSRGLDPAAVRVPGGREARRRTRAAELAGDGNGLPDGIALDLDLRWRTSSGWRCSARSIGPRLQAALDAEPTAVSRVEHSRAMASLPDAEAKAWAWQRFTGEVDVPN